MLSPSGTRWITTLAKLPHSAPQKNVKIRVTGDISTINQGSETSIGIVVTVQAITSPHLTPSSCRSTRGASTSWYADRVRTLARNGAIGWLFLALACGRDSASPEASARDPKAPAAAFLDEDALGDLEAVARALHQPHAALRNALGPHRLRYRAHFASTPKPPPPGLPALDQPVPRARDIHDELELVWATLDPDEPRFTLDQRNDSNRGRHVVRLGDQLYTRLEHRDWVTFAVEADLDELWLDDAQRSAYDALAFIAPAVVMQYDEEGSTADHAVLRFAMASSEQQSSSVTLPSASQRAAWREAVEFTAVEGKLELDPQKGRWRSMHVDARYHIRGSSMDGLFNFEGTLEPLDTAELRPITPPATAQPIEDRRRLEYERQELLEGLAPL